jgi:hypothetical protein
MTKQSKTEDLIVSSSLPGPLRLQVGDEVVTVHKGQHTMTVTPEMRKQLEQYGDRIAFSRAA